MTVVAATMDQTACYECLDGTVALNSRALRPVLCPHPLRLPFLFPSFSSPVARPLKSSCPCAHRFREPQRWFSHSSPWENEHRWSCCAACGGRQEQIDSFSCSLTPKDGVRRGGSWVKKRKRAPGVLKSFSMFYRALSPTVPSPEIKTRGVRKIFQCSALNVKWRQGQKRVLL